jgi:Domain of unknown function (DUF6458)
MGTGTCITLIVVGAVLRFAVHQSSTHGLNIHVVGVILILAGVLGLVLSLLVWGRGRSRPRGYDSGTPPVVEERHVYLSQPPVVEERRLYRDESPAVEQRRLYRDQSPL